jgi:1-acyl-sn-glycerol-3-phosphate acyltransferase
MRLFTRMANTSGHQIIASSLILFQKTAVPFLARIGYRIHYRGLNHIPVSGPAVLICNHVSYVDWLVIAAGCQRPVRFVMHASIYRTVLWHWFFRWAKVIPIDTHRKNPAVLRAGLREIDQALRSGGLVCIFPEGRLTRNGRIGTFRKGIEAIIRRNPVPVVPLALHGLWGSFFSHQNGPAMRSRPHKFRPRVELVAGSVVTPHKPTADHLHRIVQNLYHGMDRNEAK